MTQALRPRPIYRVRQFVQAIGARWRGPTPQELTAARKALPDTGWRLFRGMPVVDQVHALKVWRSLREAGFDDPALAQAALLHDVAKHLGHVTLVHRVLVVLIKAFAPRVWQQLKAAPEPVRRSLGYPLWAHANHPTTGARLAAEVRCLPLAVNLIRRHQDDLPSAELRSPEEVLLAALQRADDDN
jgi:hypothetical protein